MLQKATQRDMDDVIQKYITRLQTMMPGGPLLGCDKVDSLALALNFAIALHLFLSFDIYSQLSSLPSHLPRHHTLVSISKSMQNAMHESPSEIDASFPLMPVEFCAVRYRQYLDLPSLIYRCKVIFI